MANRWGKQWKQWQIFSWVSKSLQIVTTAMKLKDACSLEEKLWQTSVQFSHSVVSDSLWPHGLQHARPELNWTEASLSITNSWSSLKLRPISRVSNAIQPSHLLSSPSPPTFNLSQHLGLFQWVGFLHQVAKVLEHQSFQWIFRVDFL